MLTGITVTDALRGLYRAMNGILPWMGSFHLGRTHTHTHVHTQKDSRIPSKTRWRILESCSLFPKFFFCKVNNPNLEVSYCENLSTQVQVCASCQDFWETRIPTTKPRIPQYADRELGWIHWTVGFMHGFVEGKIYRKPLNVFFFFLRLIIGAFRFNLSLEPNHWVHSDDVNLLKRVANGNQPTITITRWAPPVLTWWINLSPMWPLK